MRLRNWVLFCGLHWTTAQWTKPNAQNPSFTDTFILGENIYLTWDALNSSISDLWVTRWDPSVDNWNTRIALSVNISNPGSVPWNIAIDPTLVKTDTRFIARFLPAGSAFSSSPEVFLNSPGFNLITVGQAVNGTPSSGIQTPPVRTASTIASTATIPSATSSNQAGGNGTAGGTDDTMAPVGPGVKIGIGIGAVGAAIICAVMLFFFWIIRRRRNRHKKKLESEVEADGPYEVLGDKRLPAELNSKDSSLHELNGGKETSVSEAGSSMIHEMGVIIKKPGLHELPG